MLFVELAFIVLLALLASVAFTAGRLRGSAWPGAVWFFLLLFFGTWALGVWLRPMGPTFWGVRLVPYVIAAVAISTLLAAAMSSGGRSSESADSEGPRRVATEVTTWAFFWVAVVFSIAALAVHYLAA